MKTRLLLLSMACSFAYMVSAAPPVVSGITASQRTGTKLVDVTYNLTLDAGQKAFVELWFSPDNGLTFPVRCTAITGAVDANVTAGTNKAETERLALAAPKVQTHMEGKQIRKVIVVPERLVNIVCG